MKMEMQIDHIIPIAKDGSYCVENLQYLTPEENRAKATKIPDNILNELLKVMEMENE